MGLYVQGGTPGNAVFPSFYTIKLCQEWIVFVLKGAGPVKYCMCDQDNCNDVEYNVYLERARDLFTNLSMRAQDFIFPFDNSSRVSRSRVGKQTRLQCYTCGSLFNRDSPACDRFDPQNPGQLTTCNDGEACLLYTWRKSKTELGEYFYFSLSNLLSSISMSVCLFVSDKRQNGWTDLGYIFLATYVIGRERFMDRQSFNNFA